MRESLYFRYYKNCTQPLIVLKLAKDDMTHYCINAIVTLYTLRRHFDQRRCFRKEVSYEYLHHGQD